MGKKNKEDAQKRADFIQKAFQDTKSAANELEVMAIGLRNAKYTDEIIRALREILCISEATIFRDLKK